MAWDESALLAAGFVPSGVTPKRINSQGEATWQTEGQENLGALNNALSGVFQSMQLAHQRKQEKLKNRFDMYKTLRDSGYDHLAAAKASEKMEFPTDAPAEQTMPEGFTRVGGKVVKDPTYANPLEQKKLGIRQEELNLKKKMAEGDNLTPGQRLLKDKKTDEIFTTVERNKARRASLEKAEQALQNIPQGEAGKWNIKYLERFDPDNPILTDFQNLKSVVTDAQFMGNAKAKGSVSDYESKALAEAVANGDLVSVAKLKPVLERLRNFMDAEEAGMFGSYKKNYNEDLRPLLYESKSNEKQNSGQKQGGQIMIDGNGNRAMVYPDGTFEEI